MSERSRKPVEPAPGVSQYERYQTVQVKRSEIRKAPYNPRVIDDYTRKKLEENLATVGLLQPPIVNRRTMNLVAGHQRVSAMDALEGNQEYTLTVALVDMDPATEKTQNVFLNNPSAMGSWDIELLRRLMEDDALPPDAMGFDTMDLEMLFDEIELAPHWTANDALAEMDNEIASMAGQAPKGTQPGTEAWSRAQQSRQDNGKKAVNKPAASDKAKQESESSHAGQGSSRSMFDGYKEGLKIHDETDPEYFVVLVFDNRDDASLFMTNTGKPGSERYLDGYRVSHLLGHPMAVGDGARRKQEWSEKSRQIAEQRTVSESSS